MLTVYQFPTGVRVEVNPQALCIATRARCGAHTAYGAPPSPASREDYAKADALGYDPVIYTYDGPRYDNPARLWRMTVDNELAHTWLAHVTGRVESAVLWHEAHKDLPGYCAPSTPAERAAEEGTVLAFQRQWSALSWRPWDVWSYPP